MRVATLLSRDSRQDSRGGEGAEKLQEMVAGAAAKPRILNTHFASLGARPTSSSNRKSRTWPASKRSSEKLPITKPFNPTRQ